MMKNRAEKNTLVDTGCSPHYQGKEDEPWGEKRF